MDEADYAYGRVPKRLYFSKPFARSSDEPKDQRFAYQVFEEGERTEYAVVNKEVVLHTSPLGRQQIKLLFQTTSRRIHEIIIQRFNNVNGKPVGRSLLSIRGDEIKSVVDLIRVVQTGRIGGDARIRIEADEVDQFVMSEEALERFVRENAELVAEIVENDVTTKEVVSLAYRKRQLERFRTYLYIKGEFEAYLADANIKRPERGWQLFFEENQWILGYGLTFVFAQALEGRTLEQVTSGYSVQGPGKRVDALLRTHGFVNALCFVELKTHLTPLTQKDTYRAGVWPISGELAGGIGQVQKTVHDAVSLIRGRLASVDADGAQTGEVSYLYKPRSIVVAGNLREFQSGEALNETRYSCFEMFRRSLKEPEIVTYDELYERARFIVEDRSET